MTSQGLAEEMAKVSPFAGEVKVDDSYFGGVRKGKHGRGAAGKVPVFGLLKSGGKVCTVRIPNACTLVPKEAAFATLLAWTTL